MSDVIARWTTPAITYKPSAVNIADVDEIYLVIRQHGSEKIRKSKADAVIDTNGFTWVFEQSETARLKAFDEIIVKIDYTSGTARYTTNPKKYTITESGINEVI